MKLLLDTNSLIWLLTEPERLSATTLETIERTSNDVYVSVVSVWEIEIKAAKGRLRAPANLADALDQQMFKPLVVTMAHVLAVESLPRHHRDPFDRMLLAQAQLEELTIVSSDREMRRYPISVLPAI